MKKPFMIFLTLLLCMGVFAGCGGSSSEEETTEEVTTEEETTEEETTQEEEDLTVGTGDETEEDIIGKVTYVGSSYISVDLYEADALISDYTSVDVSALSDTGNSDTVTLDTDAEFQYVSAGLLYDTTVDEIAVGDMIAVTTGEDGAQQVIILEAEEGETEETSDTADM